MSFVNHIDVMLSQNKDKFSPLLDSPNNTDIFEIETVIPKSPLTASDGRPGAR